MKRVCENCKYADVWIFDEPCGSCDIETNNNWEEK